VAWIQKRSLKRGGQSYRVFWRDPAGKVHAKTFSRERPAQAFAREIESRKDQGLYVRDLVAGTTQRASVDSRSGDIRGEALGVSINADGRYVAFGSNASDLVRGDANATYDVFVRDMVTRTTIRASLDTEGGDPNGASVVTSIDSDGVEVAFSSLASDLVPSRGDKRADVFLARWDEGFAYSGCSIGNEPCL
jgi:Tol biopolymer transport system component